MATVISQLAIKIAAETAEFTKGIKSVQSQFSTFTSSLTSIAGAVGVAFSAQAVAGFALEVSRLAGEAEGVRAAFEKLPNNIALMDDLKKSTAGTVSELDLMKRSVQAANFGISLKALPELLKFAAIRAQQTGQSVDYLVDSIITGIGRKSPLILDNLGISAVRLKEQFGGAALEAQSIGSVAEAVGRIATSELAKMGEFSENASTKLQRLSASWTNLKVSIGDAANSNGLFGASIDVLTEQMNNLASSDLSGFEKLMSIFGGVSGAMEASMRRFVREQKALHDESEKTKQVIKEVDHAFVEFGGNIEAYAKAIESHVLKQELLAEFQKRIVDGTKSQSNTYDDLKNKLAELTKSFESLDITNQKDLITTGQQIIAINKKIEAIDRLRKATEGLNMRPEIQNAEVTLRNNVFEDSGSLVSLQQAKTGGDVGSNLPQFSIDNEALEESIDRYVKNIKRVTSENKGFVSDTKEIWADFSGIIINGVSDVAYALGEAAAGVGDFGDAIIKALVGFAKQMGEILIASGVAALAAKKLITNPYGAIIAGAALVAIAGFASASLNRSQSSFNGGGSGGSSSAQFATSSGIRNSEAERINFTFRIEGTTLVAVIDKTKKEQGRLIGTGS